MKFITTMMSSILLFLSISYIEYVHAVDCFGWSWTKRASYVELLPSMIYFDQVDWINLNPTRSCTFKTTEAVFLKLYDKKLTASY